MKRFWILIPILFLITSCQKTPIVEFSPTATQGFPIASLVSTPTYERQLSEELYFLLRSSSDRKYHWARLPANCVIGKQNCPSIEFISGFPETEYSNISPDPVSWSPDGNLALFFHPYNASLNAYDPHTNAFQVISQNLPLERDTILWSPDSTTAILIESGAEPTSSNHAMLYHIHENTMQELQNSPFGVKIPLGWKSNTETIWLIENFPSKTDLQNGKSDVGRMDFYQFDVATNQWQALANVTNMNGDYAALSPNRQFVAFMTVKDKKSWITLFDLAKRSFHDLGPYGVLPIWSPDNHWLVSYFQKGDTYEIYLIDPSNGQSSTIGRYTTAPTLFSWLPDSQHLLVQLDEPVGNQLILSIPDGAFRVFEFPGLPSHAYSVAGLSIQKTNDN
jgi:hypothetical protein